MLEVFRKHSKSIVIKILFGLLILSFGAWGIGDMIRVSATVDWVAEVGPSRIGPNELSNEVQQEVQKIQQQLGPAFRPDMISKEGIANLVLRRLVDRRLMSMGAEELKVTVPDEVVSGEIRRDGMFANKSGQFDRFAYERLLRENGLNEDRYVALLRGDMIRGQFLRSLLSDAGKGAPKTLAEGVYRHRFQRRAAEVVKVADAAMPEPAQPTAEALAWFHQNSAAKYTAPEYRALTILRLEASALSGGIAVTEEQAKEAFDQRAAEFTSPEKRDLRQIVVAKEEEARKAFEEIAKGGDFTKVAKEVAGLSPDALSLGKMARDELLPEVAAAAFGVDKGGVTPPVHSILGWHVVQVTDIEAGRQTTFAEAREKVMQEVRKEKAVEALYELANKAEDKVGGGGTLEEAGKELGIRVQKVAAVDAKGLDPSGQPVADLPPGKEFLKVAFATGANQDSVLTEAGKDGFFMLHVDKVTAPALRPLDEVRAQVATDWKAAERAKAAAELAGKLAAAAREGKELAAVAPSFGFAAGTAGPFTRDGVGLPKEVPADMAAKLFEVKAGEVIEHPTQGAVLVARLKEIAEADPAADGSTLAGLRGQLANEMRGDLMQQLSEGLRGRFPVKINNAGIKKLFDPKS